MIISIRLEWILHKFWLNYFRHRKITCESFCIFSVNVFLFDDVDDISVLRVSTVEKNVVYTIKKRWLKNLLNELGTRSCWCTFLYYQKHEIFFVTSSFSCLCPGRSITTSVTLSSLLSTVCTLANLMMNASIFYVEIEIRLMMFAIKTIYMWCT